MPKSSPFSVSPAAPRRSERIRLRSAAPPTSSSATSSSATPLPAAAAASQDTEIFVPAAPGLLAAQPSEPALSSHSPEHVRPPRLQRRRCRDAILQVLQDNPAEFSQLIAFSREPDFEIALQHRVEAALNAVDLPLPVPSTSLLSWFFSVLTEPSSNPPPASICGSLAVRQHAARRSRCSRRSIAVPLFLYKFPERKDAFTHTVAVFSLHRLPDGQEYPPRKHWVAHDAASAKKWGDYMASTPLPDKRKRTRQLYAPLVIDKARLQLIIPAEVSCIVRDADSGAVVFAVFRNFCGVSTILRWAKEVVRLANITRRSVRVRQSPECLSHRHRLIHRCLILAGGRWYHRPSWIFGGGAQSTRVWDRQKSAMARSCN